MPQMTASTARRSILRRFSSSAFAEAAADESSAFALLPSYCRQRQSQRESCEVVHVSCFLPGCSLRTFFVVPSSPSVVLVLVLVMSSLNPLVHRRRVFMYEQKGAKEARSTVHSLSSLPSVHKSRTRDDDQIGTIQFYGYDASPRIIVCWLLRNDEAYDAGGLVSCRS
jgi:hypothetical protein